MTGIEELGYLGFEVSDMPRWQRFAAEVMGVGLSAGPQDTLRLRIDAAAARLILLPGKADDLAFVGWKVASPAAVDAFALHLQQQGVAYTWATAQELSLRDALHMLHFSDPEGNRHEVYAAVPVSAAAPAFHSPLVTSGFVTGAGGAGHVVFEADHYPQMVAFAQNILGAKLSDHIYLQPAPGVRIEVSFFHANERHHSLAVAPRAPGQTVKKRIHHFMLEVGSVADIGRARDRCLDFGLPVVMDIGQHPNDQMISFYAHTPSGFLFEFGWGGVKVDQASWQAAHYEHVSEWGHRPFGALPSEAQAVPAAAVEVA